MPADSKFSLDYLVGGPRISLGDAATAQGPRSHILGFTRGLQAHHVTVSLALSSSMRGMGRFAKIPEGAAIANERRRFPTWFIDVSRILMSAWTGLQLARNSCGRKPEIIYERVAVYQSLTSFHPGRRTAKRVVESNGLMADETARERAALAWLPVARWIERRVYRRADLVIAVSEALADALCTFAEIDRGKILVIPNGVDSDVLEASIAPDRMKIGFVGSLVKWQRLDWLIRAVKLAQSDMTVEIVGDGPERADLEALVDELGLGKRVTFYGRLPREAAIDVMATWTAGFSGHGYTEHTTMYHSPLKLYEYAGLGMPILASPSMDASSLSEIGVDVRQFSDLSSLAGALDDVVDGDVDIARRMLQRDAVARTHAWGVRAKYFLTNVEGLRHG